MKVNKQDNCEGCAWLSRRVRWQCRHPNSPNDIASPADCCKLFTISQQERLTRAVEAIAEKLASMPTVIPPGHICIMPERPDE